MTSKLSQHIFSKSIFAKQNTLGSVPSSVAVSKLIFADFRAKCCGFFLQNENINVGKSVKNDTYET